VGEQVFEGLDERWVVVDDDDAGSGGRFFDGCFGNVDGA